VWELGVVCSGCADEYEITVDDLEEVEREVCPCGYCVVLVWVASLEPVWESQIAPAKRARFA
jgi:hypothetical protein